MKLKERVVITSGDGHPVTRLTININGLTYIMH